MSEVLSPVSSQLEQTCLLERKKRFVDLKNRIRIYFPEDPLTVAPLKEGRIVEDLKTALEILCCKDNLSDYQEEEERRELLQRARDRLPLAIGEIDARLVLTADPGALSLQVSAEKSGPTNEPNVEEPKKEAGRRSHVIIGLIVALVALGALGAVSAALGMKLR